ncbi:MAG: hypothetical protein M3220_14165, partial [Chloroflexota bacterium]|nr:hypothetical protein [Chloroflexota bacterium]
MRHSKWLVLLSLIVAAAMILSACGGDGEEGVAEEPIAGEEVVEEEPIAEEEVVEEAAPAEEEAVAGEAGACNLTLVAGADERGNAILREFLDQFEAEHPGVTTEIIAGAESATDRLGQYLQCFAQQCTDFDVMQIDVIWPGDLAEHLL